MNRKKKRHTKQAIGVLVCCVLGALLAWGVSTLVKQDEQWANWCRSQGGHVLSGGKGGDLCVRNGLIIGSN